jgi:hypothetical protein
MSFLKQRASQSLSFQKSFLPQTWVSGPLKKLGGLQNFAFPNEMNLLSDISPWNTNGMFDSSFMYNKLSLGIGPAFF